MPLFQNRRETRQANRATRRSERQVWKQTKLTARGERQSSRQGMISNLGAKAIDAFKPGQSPTSAVGGNGGYGDEQPVSTVQTAGLGQYGWLIALVVLGAIMKKK